MSLLRINKLKFLAIFVALIFGFVPLNADNCSKEAISMHVTNVATINEILNQLSDKCSFSIVAKDAIASQKLQENINGINIKKMTLNQVFNIILTQNNLNYKYENGVLLVSSLFTKTFKVDYITSVREGIVITKSSVDSSSRRIDNDGKTNSNTETDNVISSTETFDFWKNIGAEITYILNNGTEIYKAIQPIINPNAGLITVTATRSQIDRVEKYIASLQKRLKKQVMLDVSIIKVDLSNNYKTGIDWSKFELGFGSYLPNVNTFAFENSGTPSSSFKKALGAGAFTISSALNFNINGMVNFLEAKGNTKVISSPKVLAIHNQPALISVGTNYYYLLNKQQKEGKKEDKDTIVEQEQYSSFVGILLNILPEISDDNKIMLRINPSLSELSASNDPVQVRNGNFLKAPNTEESKLSTVAYVNDGDTVILGGLINQSKKKDNTNVPFLSSIPLVGGLFKSTNDIVGTTELVFVITPHIVKNTSRPISDSLKELGFSKSLYEY